MPGCAIGAGQFTTNNIDVSTTYPKDLQAEYFARDWINADPVIKRCGTRETEFHWGVDQDPKNIVVSGAADFGLLHGTSCSSQISGNSLIISLADTQPLSIAARAALSQRIKSMHIDYLAQKAKALNLVQRETIKMFAHGMRAKEIAHEFSITEDAIKLRKVRILKQIGITNFTTAIHVCAVVGVTVHS